MNEVDLDNPIETKESEEDGKLLYRTEIGLHRVPAMLLSRKWEKVIFEIVKSPISVFLYVLNTKEHVMSCIDVQDHNLILSDIFEDTVGSLLEDTGHVYYFFRICRRVMEQSEVQNPRKSFRLGKKKEELESVIKIGCEKADMQAFDEFWHILKSHMIHINSRNSLWSYSRPTGISVASIRFDSIHEANETIHEVNEGVSKE